MHNYPEDVKNKAYESVRKNLKPNRKISKDIKIGKSHECDQISMLSIPVGIRN